MFDHVTIRVTGRDASQRFYNTVLPVLGIAKPRSDDEYTESGRIYHPHSRELRCGSARC